MKLIKFVVKLKQILLNKTSMEWYGSNLFLNKTSMEWNG